MEEKANNEFDDLEVTPSQATAMREFLEITCRFLSNLVKQLRDEREVLGEEKCTHIILLAGESVASKVAILRVQGFITEQQADYLVHYLDEYFYSLIDENLQ